MSVMRKGAADNFLRGAELLKHKAVMMTMAAVWSLFAGLLAALFFVFASWVLADDGEKSVWLTVKKAELATGAWMKNRPVSVCLHGQCWDVPAIDIVQSRDFTGLREKADEFGDWLVGQALFGVLFAVLGAGATAFGFSRWGKAHSDDEHIRGARLVEADELKQMDYPKASVTIGGIHMRQKSEMLHLLVAGAVGTGKSVAIMEQLDAIRAAGKRAIVYDPHGEFVEKYYRNGVDKILNPLDSRGESWSPWQEIVEVTDYRQMAAALVPDRPNAHDPFFENSARTVIACLLEKLSMTGRRDISEFLRLLTSVPLHELHEAVVGTPAAPLLDPDVEKTALSVRATASQAVEAFTLLNEGSFSIQEWVRNEDVDEWLFLTSRPGQLDALRPLLSCWIDIVGRSVMLLPRSPHEARLWLVIDEFPSLNKIPGIKTIMTECRKWGLAVILGLQNLSQLREIYGRDLARTIISMCQTWLILRVADKESAEEMAGTLASREIQERDESLSFGSESVRDGTSLQSRRSEQKLVLPGEIQKLPDLVGFLSLAGDLPVAKVKLQPKSRPSVAESFVQRQESTVDDLL